MRGAMVFQVDFQVLPRQDGGFTAVRTGDWKAAALGVVGTERVKNKLFVAVTAGHQPLRALAQLVLAEMPPLHLHAAFVLAVERLVATRARVFLRKTNGDISN